MKIIFVSILISTLFACSSQPAPLSKHEAQSVLIECPEQRPQMCTMDYKPVCATRDTGIRCVTTPCPSTKQKTYSNACSACADSAVLGYIADECAPAVEQ
jgi:hypothetical protein